LWFVPILSGGEGRYSSFLFSLAVGTAQRETKQLGYFSPDRFGPLPPSPTFSFSLFPFWRVPQAIPPFSRDPEPGAVLLHLLGRNVTVNPVPPGGMWRRPPCFLKTGFPFMLFFTVQVSVLTSPRFVPPQDRPWKCYRDSFSCSSAPCRVCFFFSSPLSSRPVRQRPILARNVIGDFSSLPSLSLPFLEPPQQQPLQWLLARSIRPFPVQGRLRGFLLFDEILLLYFVLL